jgi:PAS domain-containing protein
MQDLTCHLDELGNTANAVFAVNQQHAIETWNRGAEALFGRSASSAVGQICHTVIRGRLPSGKAFCAATAAPWSGEPAETGGFVILNCSQKTDVAAISS